MLPIDAIVRTALREHDGATPDVIAYTESIKRAIEQPDKIPSFSRTSRPLDLVRFRCLLQDTGYPAEVYLPEDNKEAEDGEPAPMDWSKLQERWVGWATEIPGEQSWKQTEAPASQNNVSQALASLSLNGLPAPAKGKYSLAALDSDAEYTGALLKVYDTDASFRPASVHEVVGIVSAAPLPMPFAEGEGEGEPEASLVPAIHVLLQPTPVNTTATAASDADATRSKLVSYLAKAFDPPDAVAAELLLLALIAYPATRPGGMPLGTLSLNLVRPPCESPALPKVLSEVVSTLVSLPLTLPLLHSTSFRPSSDGNSLSAGLLQLAPGTLLLINEDGLGNGGQLAEKALGNIQALNNALGDQAVSYQYPYTDGVRIECALRSIITSEGKSLLPADVNLPVTLSSTLPSGTEDDLTPMREYLSFAGSAAHAQKVNVPDTVGEKIQEAFVADRRASGNGSAEAAEGRLRRRMKIARLMALSCTGDLTEELWQRTVDLDTEIEKRLDAREARRRQEPLGQPTANGKTEFNGQTSEVNEEASTAQSQ